MSVQFLLKKKKNTEELHVFEATPSDDGCVPLTLSRCQKVNKNETETSITGCLNEVDMRKKCADIGPPVCGTCVSTFYTTY